MSRTANAFLPLVLCLAVIQAHAQGPGSAASAVAPAAGAAAVSAAAPVLATPMEVPPAEAGLTARALRLNSMESELALALKGLQLDTANAQRNDLNTKISGVKSGTNQVPELIGISGARGVYRAQFLSGSAVVEVGVGDWVSSDWRVSKLSSAGVELAKRGSNARHQVIFGQQPVSSKELAADIAAAANAGAFGSMGSPTFNNPPSQSFPIPSN